MEANKCVVCDEEKHVGLKLYTTFICLQCEHNIIHTEPREEKYNYYVKKLKSIDESISS